MTEQVSDRTKTPIDTGNLSQGERDELIALGVLSTFGEILSPPPVRRREGFASVPRLGIQASSVLNEAHEYGSAFSRGLRIELENYSLLFISGTASVDERGETAHVGDLAAQSWRTYRNITTLLESEGASWQDVVKCTCYLRDIERDYSEFNRVRTAFFDWLGLNPYPSSVGVQARLCRDELLVEIEAIAILKKVR
jgi:enamine deaminase RidA (YjgF/YER057c/UK114 family)